MPTLRTIKNAVITSNIDGSCAIDPLKGGPLCTVKEIRFSGRNFSSLDDFEQHRAPGRQWNSGMTGLSAVCGACRSKENKTAIVRDRNSMQAQFTRRPFWLAKGKEIQMGMLMALVLFGLIIRGLYR
jgi:hypothetical protein